MSAPRLEVRVDGTSRQVFEVPGEAIIGHYELRLRLSNGSHTFVASFTNPPTEPPVAAAAAASRRGGKAAKKVDRPRLAREIEIERFELEGPFAIDSHDPSLASLATRKRILFCAPDEDDSLGPMRDSHPDPFCDAGLSSAGRARRDQAVRRPGDRLGARRPARPRRSDGHHGDPGVAAFSVSRRATG